MIMQILMYITNFPSYCQNFELTLFLFEVLIIKNFRKFDKIIIYAEKFNCKGYLAVYGIPNIM
jgi:hypothetical protein